MGLDSYDDDALVEELSRRRLAETAGLCSYCGGERGENTAMGWSSCRFPVRHGREPGHVPQLILGAIRWDGSVVSQDEIDGRRRLGSILATDQPAGQTQPSFTCPRCGMTSYNPNDIANNYCGNCHEFMGAPAR